MSLLVEKLIKQRQFKPQAMGFLLNKPQTEKSQMLLIAETAVDNCDKMADNLKAADAVLLDITRAYDVSAMEKMCQIKDAAPAGGRLKSSTAAVIEKTLNAKCDFVVFPLSAPVTLTRKEKLGRILEIDGNLTEGLLRAIGDLPLDAVMVTDKVLEPALTINGLMYLQRLLLIVNKPVLAVIPDNWRGPELQSLWDMGLSGVVVAVNDEKTAQNLSELRAAIEKLEAPAFRKKDKTTAILPRIADATTPHPEHEEEEE